MLISDFSEVYIRPTKITKETSRFVGIKAEFVIADGEAKGFVLMLISKVARC